MKLVRQQGAPVMKNAQGIDIPSPVIDTVRTTVMHGKSLHIIVGLFAYDGARDEGKQPIDKMEFLFNQTKLPTRDLDVGGIIHSVTLNGSGQHYYVDPETGDEVILTQDQIDSLTMTYLGQGSYDDVMGKITIINDKVDITDQGARDWLMAQLDFDGLPFLQNWVLQNGSV